MKVPRPCHQKKDPVAAEAFKTTLSQKLAALKLPASRPVRLWVADEMRYGLQPVTRRVWALRGIRAVAPVHPRYQWGYVFGALQVGGDIRNISGATLSSHHVTEGVKRIMAIAPRLK